MIKYLSILVLLAPFLAFAQGQIGSPYTRFGLGDLHQNSFASGRAMSGTSYVFSGNNEINVVNPASYAASDSMVFNFNVGIEGGYRYFETNDLNTGQYDVQLTHLAFSFPITHWWGSAFGVMPYSTKSYNIVSNNLDFDIDKNYIYNGSGGINQVFWGNGFSPLKGLNIGINVFYYFGNLSQDNALIFNDDTGNFININEQHKIHVSDFGFDMGLQYRLVLNEKNSLLIGGVFAANNKINSKRSSIVTNSLATGGSAIIDTVYQSILEDGEITIPMRWGLGLGYQFSDKLTLGVDYSVQNWSEALFFGSADSLANSNRISLGLEFIPAGYSGATLKYGQKVRYRLGAHFENTYLNFSDAGQQITDLGISFGFGLPMKRSKSQLNVFVELGQRGTLESDLLRERYAIMGINFCLSDIWFIKRKFD
jgi:hypothetical protein